MTLSEILAALPPQVGFLLQNSLDGTILPDDPTAEEIEVASKLVVTFVKDEFPNESNQTYELLDKVPAAVMTTLA